MLKLLKQEAQCYFHNRPDLSQTYRDLKQTSQQVHFFLMLLYNNTDSVLPFLAEHSNIEPAPLLTALWAYSLHIDQSSASSKPFFTLVSQLQAKNIIDRSLILSELPQWVVQGAGLVETHAFEKRIARVYTKINYEQSKHSLIRENNEGYTKLILLLSTIKNTHDHNAIWKKILSLVGNFDLDPDRVLDVIVQASMFNNEQKHFLTLLKNFRKQSVVITFGNKLKSQNQKGNDSSKNEKGNDPTPLSEKQTYCGQPQLFDGVDPGALFKEIPFLPNPHLSSLAAECIKNELFTYNDLVPYLEPSDLTLKKISGKKSDLALQMVYKSFTLSMVEIDQNEQLKLLDQENSLFEGQLLHSSKLSVITEILRSNNWQDFTRLWVPLKNKFDLILYQPLLHVLLDLLEWSIQPLLPSLGFHQFFRTQKKQNRKFEESQKGFQRLNELSYASVSRLLDLITYIGRYLGFRPKLFIKLCRILKNLVKDDPLEREMDQKVKELIKVYLVPANSYTESNGPMALQLFSLLESFEYHFRYECYLLVYKETMTNNSYVARIFESIKRRQNIIVNNLSKENKKVFIKKISKLTHNQALPVLYWIARRIVMQDYEAVVPEIVSVLSNSTPLTLDMTIFVMLYTLNEHKESTVNIKTHQFQPWFKNVITFISTFFRKYLEADIQPVFDYILVKTAMPFSELEDEDQLPGALLKLLHSILNKMHGSVMIEEVNKKKFDAIAAGPKLQTEILELSSEVRAAKKSKLMLEKFFWEQNRSHQCGHSLAFNLLVLLIQKRAQLLVKAFIDDLRIVADIYDEFTLLIVQIVRVLQYQSQDYSHYALLLPQKPLSQLLIDYKVPLEMACEIMRPGIKHIATMDQQQWNALVRSFTESYTQCLKDPKYLMKSLRPNEKVQNYLNVYKGKVLELIPPPFFTTFWFLTIDSVYFPAKSYQQKIDDVKKKMDQSSSKKNEKEVEKIKTLLEKLTKEEEQQRKKYEDTISEENLKKLEIDCLKGTIDKEKQKKENILLQFAETFVQICLLPRMMMDRAEALYCVKFTTAIIKANKMQATKSIRLITIIIEYVMNYLPFTTHREANSCISVFLSEILSIFINWSDSVKLKQDLKNILGIEQTSGKDNYPKLRDYLVKLFERVGNIVKSIKEEPYIIKNCLYLLEKVESIPGYKEQADELMQHMTELKQNYTAVDMRTILERQITMLGIKKNQLPEKPEERKKPGQEDNGNKRQSIPRQALSQKHKESVHKEVSRESSQKEYSKEQNPQNIRISNVPSDVAPIRHENYNRNQPEPPRISQPTVSTIAQQKKNRQSPSPYVPRSAMSEKHSEDKHKNEPRNEDKNRNRGDSKFRETPQQYNQSNRFSDRPPERFTDKPPEKKLEHKPELKMESRHEPKMDSKSENKLESRPQRKMESRAEEGKGPKEGQPQGIKSTSQVDGGSSSIPPPKRLSDVKREQELKLSSQKDNSSKKQQETKGGNNSSFKSQKPSQSINEEKSQLPPKNNPIENQTQTKNTPSFTKPEDTKNQDNRSKGGSSARGEQREKDNRDTLGREKERRRDDSTPQKKESAWREREENRRWQQNRQKPYFSRDSRGDNRREDRKEKQKEKERQRKHEKYRSRSREKYSRK